MDCSRNGPRSDYSARGGDVRSVTNYTGNIDGGDAGGPGRTVMMKHEAHRKVNDPGCPPAAR